MKKMHLLCMIAVAITLFSAAAEKKMNVLLITADDLGMQVGCYGDQTVPTPNLDRLAAQGVRFTQAYITQSSCSSSRSTMLTGLYPHQNGQVDLVNDYEMHPGIETLPAMLKNQGYRTGIIGKLHVRPENAFPFERVNLADNPEYTLIFQTLETELKTWQEKTDDPFADPDSLADFTAKTDALCNKPVASKKK